MAKLLPDGPIDTLGLRDAVLGLPDQLAEADDIGPVAGLPAIGGFDHVVVVAPGAARTAGDIARVLVAPVATVPVLVHPGPTLPAFVTARSLVVVVSVDDDVAALSALRTADERGAATVVVASAGSELAEAGRMVGSSSVSTPVDVPVARAAVGALTVHLLAVLEQLGQYSDVESAVSAAVGQVGRRRTELAGHDHAIARLARRIGRTLPIVYGSDDLAGVAARHWKRRVNLDAKAASFAGSLPDIAWDEISGWGQHGDMTRQVFTMVTLRHDHEPPGTDAAMRVVEELVEEVVHERHEVAAEGNGPLAQVLDLTFQGDLLSWYLAQELEIDPGPTAAITTIWSAP